MEIIKSRYGIERTLEKIDTNRIRVMGESQFQRISTDASGKTTMFDFEGGPILSVGSKVDFQKLKWLIHNIEPIDSKLEGLSECILTVSPDY